MTDSATYLTNGNTKKKKKGVSVLLILIMLFVLVSTGTNTIESTLKLLNHTPERLDPETSLSPFSSARLSDSIQCERTDSDWILCRVARHSFLKIPTLLNSIQCPIIKRVPFCLYTNLALTGDHLILGALRAHSISCPSPSCTLLVSREISLHSLEVSEGGATIIASNDIDIDSITSAQGSFMQLKLVSLNGVVRIGRSSPDIHLTVETGETGITPSPPFSPLQGAVLLYKQK